VIKKCLLVIEELVQALVELVDLHQFKARPQTIGHRAVDSGLVGINPSWSYPGFVDT
jgi:hypothetical protein